MFESGANLPSGPRFTSEVPFFCAFVVVVVGRFLSHTYAKKIVQATIGDLVVVALHGLITDADALFEPLNRLFVTILLNLSPYLKSLTPAGASRIVSLFERFARPSFLLKREDNHQFVFFLLETMNNLVQYNMHGHANLIYGLCRARKSIHDLQELQIRPSALPPTDFFPTDFWLNSWKSRLPLQVVVR